MNIFTISKMIDHLSKGSKDRIEMATEMSRMITEMGFDAPLLEEDRDVWQRKLYTFVKAIYDEKKGG